MPWDVSGGYVVKLGGNYFIDCGQLITYDDKPLFNLRRCENGDLGIAFDIYDKSGAKIGEIHDSNVVAGDRSRYLLTRTKDWHTIADKKSSLEICRIDKRPKQEGVELAVTVKMYTHDGFLLEADPDRINIGTNTMVNNIMRNCAVGIAIGESSGGAGIALSKPL